MLLDFIGPRVRAAIGERWHLGILIALLALLPAGCGAAPEEDRPHLLLIVCDALRADRLQLHGAPAPAAPRLSEWAQEGLVFRRATAPSNWTRPSMLSIFTGRHPDPDRVLRTDERIPADVPLLAERLAQAGYETLAVSANPFQSSEYGTERGFRVHLDLGVKGAQRSGHWKHEIAAPVVIEHVEQVLTSRIRRDRPVFLYVHLMDPHLPYDPPAEFRHRCDPDYGGPFDGRSEPFRALSGEHVAERLAPEDNAQIRALYEGEIAALDAGLARLRALVDEQLGDRRVVTIVTADHGEAFGEGELGYWMHGNGLGPELLHVPLILHGAGVRGVSEERVGLVDLAPTLLELAGVPQSRDGPPPDGRSLVARSGTRIVPASRGPADAPAYIAYRALPGTPGTGTGELAVLRGRWRAERQQGHWRLFDEDTGQNVSSAMQTELLALRAVAEAWLAERAGAGAAEGDTIPLSAEAQSGLEALGYFGR